MEKRNSQCEHGHPFGANKDLVLHVWLRCGSLSPVSYLANEFDVRSVLHGQVSLAAINQSLCNSWGYERLQKSKDSLKACLGNVNILDINQSEDNLEKHFFISYKEKVARWCM